MMIFVDERREFTVGKGEVSGYQDFPQIPKCFQKPSPSGDVNIHIWDCLVNLTWRFTRAKLPLAMHYKIS